MPMQRIAKSVRPLIGHVRRYYEKTTYIYHRIIISGDYWWRKKWMKLLTVQN